MRNNMFFENIEKLRKNDTKGSVLVSVIILLVLLSFILSTILMVTITSINNTTSIQQAMQAQANADSAQDIATSYVNKKLCNSQSNIYQSTDEASKGIYYTVGITFSTVSDGSDTKGNCNSAKAVKFKITGYSDSRHKASYKETIVKEWDTSGSFGKTGKTSSAVIGLE